MNSSAGTNPAFSPDGSSTVPSSNYTTSGEGAQMGAITGILIASIAIMIIFCVFAAMATLVTCCNPTFLARLSPDQRSLERRTGDGQPAASEAAGAAPGVDEATLMRYPKMVYSSQADGRGSCTTASSCCSICLADYKDAEVLRLLPDCGHAFHLKCVDPWLRLHSMCPICRRASPILPPLAGP